LAILSYCCFNETDSVATLIELSKTNKFDLIVLDIHLTDGNTLTVLQTLKFCSLMQRSFSFLCARGYLWQKSIALWCRRIFNKRADETELKELLLLFFPAINILAANYNA